MSPNPSTALPGGIHEATAFALNKAAELQISLPAGSWISTGALSGVHLISIGQTAHVMFHGTGALLCKVVRAAGA